MKDDNNYLEDDDDYDDDYDDDDEDSCMFPSFCKLILAPRLDLQRLEIPVEFVKNHGNDLSDTVHLKIPTGKTWNVKLLKKNTRVWLHEGWPELVEFYSISHGHFLTCTYAGVSRFDVHIFDTTASEIHYSDFDVRTKTGTLSKKANTNAPTSSSRKARVQRKSWHNKQIKWDATPEEVKSVTAYYCENPSFVIKMQPSYVKQFILNLPCSFFDDYVSLRSSDKYILQNANGKKWVVNTRYDGRHLKMHKGWKAFAIGNNLEEGDVCVFELLKLKKVMQCFRVGIIRSADVAPNAI